ncbi:MAG: tRNA/rRNA methyltransferase [Bacteriovorax sp.]|nr:tRNA/rRNA methyltransferase [Bacteriovorax sp.]
MSKKFNRDTETKIYGENACLALFKSRPMDIIQLFLTKEKLKTFSHITKYCAQNKKAYHIVTREELDQMTKATHHEDVCMLIRKEITSSLEQYLQTKPTSAILIALENVSNPHNIGAILRSAAHFGVNGLILPDAKAATTAAAVRTSEGGAEYVNVYEASDFQKTMMLLKKNGFQILTTSSHAKKSLYDLKWEKKVVILFGEEAEGLSKNALALGDTIKIPGTDKIESLNVSVAAAVILSDYYQKVKLHEIAPRFK